VGRRKVIAVSGGFDPLHIGHVRMICAAAALGDVAVILNNDNWLLNKKGFVFMPESERREILLAIRGVTKVVITKHERSALDRSVCAELRELKPDVFCNGGDRVKSNTPEASLCRELGIETLYDVGVGGKVQSSSWLLHR
jgi:cytidyltransferase-like protein